MNTVCRTIEEYEAYINDLRHRQIVYEAYEAYINDLRHRQIVQDTAVTEAAALEQPLEDIRCQCPVCQELWS